MTKNRGDSSAIVHSSTVISSFYVVIKMLLISGRGVYSCVEDFVWNLMKGMQISHTATARGWHYIVTWRHLEPQQKSIWWAPDQRGRVGPFITFIRSSGLGKQRDKERDSWQSVCLLCSNLSDRMEWFVYFSRVYVEQEDVYIDVNVWTMVLHLDAERCLISLAVVVGQSHLSLSLVIGMRPIARLCAAHRA